MEQSWQYAGSSREGEAFAIKEADVWGQGWQVSAGEEAHVKDPVYGSSHIFRVFSIEDDNKRVEFAAGQFSNGLWGFYVRK